MTWVLLAFFSAALLGIYDILKKLSLKDNTVIPVLFFSTFTGAMLFIPLAVASIFFPQWSSQFSWYLPNMPLQGHLLLLLKSVIVGCSWMLSYFAIKHLPITIVSPIRSSGPLWTLSGALLFFGEKLNMWQWIGLSITLIFYYLFSLSGKREGISFRTNKWVLFMTLATIIGSFSSLYDKYLIQHYDRLNIQAWFQIYMIPIMGALMLFVWYPNRKKYVPFEWRYSIPLIGICLVAADFLYFWALSMDGSLIAIVSTIRRGSVIFSFSIAAIMFKEKNISIKAIILFGILVGIGIIILGG